MTNEICLFVRVRVYLGACMFFLYKEATVPLVQLGEFGLTLQKQNLADLLLGPMTMS